MLHGLKVASTLGIRRLLVYDNSTVVINQVNKEWDCTKDNMGAYCYKSMPFGLKNAGATYQRAIQTCLKDQIGRNAEAYIDDVVIKTKEPGSLIEDLQETFNNLKQWQWKLNPTKCVFRVPSG